MSRVPRRKRERWVMSYKINVGWPWAVGCWEQRLRVPIPGSSAGQHLVSQTEACPGPLGPGRGADWSAGGARRSLRFQEAPPARAGDHVLSLDPSLENQHTCTITTEEIGKSRNIFPTFFPLHINPTFLSMHQFLPRWVCLFLPEDSEAS